MKIVNTKCKTDFIQSNLKSNIFNIFLLVVSLLITPTAFAQNTFDIPSSSDMSTQFIGQIFGGLVGGNGADAFGSSIATFNSVILIVGGILVGYTIFAGTLGTAHDGEMLGKKFSSVWVPIRTTLGTALILPSMKGGYCAMQAIVMWLILQGVGFANSVWNSYVSSSALDSAFNPKIGGTAGAMIERFVYQVYAVQVCIAAENQAIQDTSESVKDTSKASIVADGTSDLAQQFNANLGSKTKYCGKITYPIEPKSTNSGQKATPSGVSALDSINKILENPIKADTSSIYAAQLAQAKTIVSQTAGIAEAGIKSSDSGKASDAALKQLVESYKKAINAATDTAMASARQSVADVAKSQGWFMAGTFATKIILVQAQLASAQSASGSATAKKRTGGTATTAADDKLFSYYNNGRGWMTGFTQITAPDSEGAQYTYEGDNGEGNADSSFIGKLTSQVIATFTDVDLTRLQSDTRHPILIAQDMGSSLLKVCWYMTLANTVIGIGGALSNAFIGALIAFCGTLAAPILLMWGVAGFLAYGLPNLPLLIWLGVLMGWVTMVIQAILAAPLWAVMHLHPNGDDLTGKGGNGYMMVLGLTIRPALIIFGLIAAIILSNLFGQFLNAIFLSSVTTPNSLNDMFNLIFIIVIYTAILTGIIQTTFSLVHKVPDELLRWIGGGHEQLGEFGRILESGTMNKVTGAAGVGVGAASNLSSGAANIGKSIKDMRTESTNKKDRQNDKEQELDQKATDFNNDKKASNDFPGESAAGVANHTTNQNFSSKETMDSYKDLKMAKKTFEKMGDNGRLSNTFGSEYKSLRDNGASHREAFSGAIKTTLMNDDTYKSLGKEAINKLSESNSSELLSAGISIGSALENNLGGDNKPTTSVLEQVGKSI